MTAPTGTTGTDWFTDLDRSMFGGFLPGGADPDWAGLFGTNGQPGPGIMPGGTAPTTPRVPVNGTPAMSGGEDLPLVVPVQYRQCAKAPRGYVVVEYNGQKVAMLKGCAMDLGLWKPRPKPWLTAKDRKTLSRAKTVAGKIDRASKTSDKLLGRRRRR